MVETDYGKRAMRRRLSRCLKLVRAESGAALALVAVLAAVVMTGGPPPSSNLAQEASTQWVDSASSSCYGY
jgi:hypothetical protein